MASEKILKFVEDIMVFPFSSFPSSLTLSRRSSALPLLSLLLPLQAVQALLPLRRRPSLT